jgi:hypothetical protein
MRRNNDMRMVLYAETFLAITAFVYMSMVCLMNAELHDTASVEQVMAQPESPALGASGVYPFDLTSPMEPALGEPSVLGDRCLVNDRSGPVKEKASESKHCVTSKFEQIFGTFIIAFLAGGFMNLERLGGLPVP